MRIAQIGPLMERVPPKTYGGTERIVHILTEELVRRGHEVTLFAAGDAQTSADLVSVYPRSLREAKLKEPAVSMLSLLNIGLAFDQQDEFDIIHDHNGYISLPTANIADTPVICTLHNHFSIDNSLIFQQMRNPYYVAISDAQRHLRPDLNYAGRIYHGLPMDDYPFSEEHDGYLLFVGRLCMDKGTHYAIKAAQRLNLPLVLAGKVDAADKEYFEDYVEPFLGENIRWVGEVDEEERNRLMHRALCFLHPVTWPEPFGLTLIEAMACGCPVVAFGRGSIPEVVKDGRTGFVVDELDGMVEAIRKIGRISRRACREYALERFRPERMVDEYITLYEKIVNQKAFETRESTPSLERGIGEDPSLGIGEKDAAGT